jgi:hypothetical protein
VVVVIGRGVEALFVREEVEGGAGAHPGKVHPDRDDNREICILSCILGFVKEVTQRTRTNHTS